MRNFAIAALVVLLTLGAGAAFAQKPEGPSFLMAYQADGSLGGDLDEPAGVPDSIVTVDITGVESFDGLNDPDNTVLIEAVGTECTMTGIGWDVTLTTIGASWLSEAVTYFDDVGQDGMGLFLTVGVGDNMPGTMTYSSGGIIDLTDNGIPNLTFAVDGDLYMQFYESFVDNPNLPDAIYDPVSTYDIAGISCGIPDDPIIAVPTLNTVGLVTLLLLLAALGTFFLMRQTRRAQ